jgi:spore germination cell wall hydrolase CwlJ-like protein
MTKISDVLRRADRAAAIAIVLALATTTGAASIGDHPDTDHPSTAQLRGMIATDDRVAVVAETPSAYVPVDAIAATPSATELAMARFALEHRCLAEAMYYEARGEGVAGEEAIAEVVFHRLQRHGYPASICGVVYQGSNEGGSGCQFSFVCNGEMDRPKSPGAWAQARLLAAKILSGYTVLGNVTGGATSFHAVDVDPDWSGSLERTVQIGNHIFYRPLPRSQALARTQGT